MIPLPIKDRIELDIQASMVEALGSRGLPFTCSECRRGCSTLHLVRVINAPGILKLCAGCYNNFVDLITPSKEYSWIPSDMFLRGESILGYIFKRIKAWINQFHA